MFSDADFNILKIGDIVNCLGIGRCIICEMFTYFGMESMSFCVLLKNISSPQSSDSTLGHLVSSSSISFSDIKFIERNIKLSKWAKEGF